MDEKLYRSTIEGLFKKVLLALDAHDPDLIEADLAAGVVTVLLGSKRSKIILSPQPPVRQLWLAAAHLGVARHFNWVDGLWIDDKDSSIELMSYFKKLVFDSVGVEVIFESVA